MYYGIYVKVLRGEDPKLENIGKSFVDGFLVYIISILYPLILAIIAFSFGFFLGYDSSAGLFVIIIGLPPLGIVLIIVCQILFITNLLVFPKDISFEKTYDKKLAILKK